MPAATAAPEPPDEPPAERGEIPRIEGRAEHLVLGVALVSELRRVRLAQDHATPRPQPGHEDAVGLGGGIVRVQRRAVGGHEACGVLEVLHADRDAGQRPRVLAAAMRSSIAVASAIARSPSRAMNALIAGFTASMRDSVCAVKSRAESSLARTLRDRSASDSVRKSIAADVSSGAARRHSRPGRGRRCSSRRLAPPSGHSDPRPGRTGPTPRGVRGRRCRRRGRSDRRSHPASGPGMRSMIIPSLTRSDGNGASPRRH